MVIRNRGWGMFEKKEVKSFELISWRISGMRSMYEYEIESSGGAAHISEYEMRCKSGGGMERVLRREAACPIDRMIGFLNSCGIMRWDGFQGKHPRGVKDGEAFSFEARVNEGGVIRADGSANFPKNFTAFRRGIEEFLRSGSL